MPYNSFDDYPMSWRPTLTKGDTPLYIALANKLEADIASGQIKPGTKLPPAEGACGLPRCQSEYSRPRV